MEIETKVMSKEIIKPSSPTPKPLRKYLLTSIDQAIFPTYIPMIYLYPSASTIPNSDKTERLKKTLPEALSRYYPLAGTIVGNHYVHCNDAGVPFLVAQSNCDLSRVLANRNHETLEKFFPNSEVRDSHDFCLAVQATYFRCGGLALGILLSHKVGDGCSAFTFAYEWAAAAASGGGTPLPPPKFNAAAYFPPLLEPSGPSDPTYVPKKEDVATKIITFHAEAISLLRGMYSGGGPRPSRVEAVSTFLWTQFVSATGVTKPFTIRYPMNIRRRADMMMSDNHFGNIVAVSRVVVAPNDGGVEVARKIRVSMEAVKSGSAATSTDVAEEEEEKELHFFFSFSSACGFPLYETDFGWGRPVWAGTGKFRFKNIVFFMDDQSGTGIEAFIHLSKQDMLKFEAHLENHMPLMKSHL